MPGRVAAAVRAASATPGEPEAPQAPQLNAAVLRQLVMLPVLWASNKIDLDHPDNALVLQSVFVTIIALGYGLIQVAIFRARRTNDQSRVLTPGPSTYIHDDDKAQDGSVSARVYDVAKLRESKLQFLMSAGMVVFLNLKWGYTQPLLMICARPPTALARARIFALPPTHSPRTGSPPSAIPSPRHPRCRHHAASSALGQPRDAHPLARQVGPGLREAVEGCGRRQPARAMGGAQEGGVGGR